MVSELIKKCIKSFEDLLENQSDKTLIKFFLEDLRSLKIEGFGGIDEVASGKDFPKNVQKYLKEIKSGIDNSCTLDSSLFDISKYLGKQNLPIKDTWPINFILDDILEDKKPEKGEWLTFFSLWYNSNGS